VFFNILVFYAVSCDLSYDLSNAVSCSDLLISRCSCIIVAMGG